MTRRLLGAAIVACTTLLTTFIASAAYPDRPVRVVVPFAVGGANDQVARLVASELQNSLKQTFVVENKPGAGGVVGMSYAVQQPGDGYTIVIGEPGAVSINPQILKDPPYSPTDDIVPLALVGEVPLIVVANPKAGIRNLEDLVNFGRKNDVSYGSAGQGTVQHLTMALLEQHLGLDMTHVPYRGGAPAMTDLIGGQIPLLPITVPTAMPHIQSGQVVPIAALSKERSEYLPDLPTAMEQGYPSVNVTIWLGFFAPKGTPDDIVETLNAEIRRIITEPATREKLRNLGIIVVDSSREEFTKLINEDITRWGEIISTIGLAQG